jgi:peptide deformylase
MTLRKIVEYPDPVLREKTRPVKKFDEQLKKLAEDMAATMYEAPGIGLAAPQIGESVKLIVVDISKKEVEIGAYLSMANPEIIFNEGHQVDEEGCLSVPELTANVKRFKKITVTYQDLDGRRQEITTEDRFAVVLQHEIDHLNGILFIDHLSALKRSLYKKKVKKWLAEKQENHA